MRTTTNKEFEKEMKITRIRCLRGTSIMLNELKDIFPNFCSVLRHLPALPS